MKEKEQEYIDTINLLIAAKKENNTFAAECYLETYKNLCETIAMLYMKEHGYNELPYFEYVPEFEYDKLLGEYVVLENYRKLKAEEAAEEIKEKWIMEKE